MTHSFPKLAFAILLGLASAGILTACENTRASNPFQEVIVKDLKDYSYDGADDLVSKSRRAFAPSTPILVGTITNVDKLERSSTFGRMITEQISARMTQRGFSVTELKMRNSVNIKEGLADASESGEYLLSRDIQSISGEHAAGGVVTGTYAVAGSEIYVNLKMINVSTGKLVAATDYAIPLTSNLRELIESDSTTFYGSSMAY
jgi:TolB-like protein